MSKNPQNEHGDYDRIFVRRNDTDGYFTEPGENLTEYVRADLVAELVEAERQDIAADIEEVADAGPTKDKAKFSLFSRSALSFETRPNPPPMPRIRLPCLRIMSANA